jgi:hypothetical protein
MARVSCHYSASPQGQLLYPRFLLIAGNHTTLQEMRSELLPDFKDQIGCRLGRQTPNSLTAFSFPRLALDCRPLTFSPGAKSELWSCGVEKLCAAILLVGSLEGVQV